MWVMLQNMTSETNEQHEIVVELFPHLVAWNKLRPKIDTNLIGQ